MEEQEAYDAIRRAVSAQVSWVVTSAHIVRLLEYAPYTVHVRSNTHYFNPRLFVFNQGEAAEWPAKDNGRYLNTFGVVL